MGQKTHPTGFRIGVNKLHNSTWFANYGAYSKVLEEDYKIRKFFEKELESVYSKAGISNLEIKRKVNQFLELLCCSPKDFFAAATGKKKFQLKSYLNLISCLKVQKNSHKNCSSR